MLALIDRGVDLLVGQLSLEQGHPAGAARDAVLGRQAVADDQDGDR